MNWRKYFSDAYLANVENIDQTPVFFPPASDSEFSEAEQCLGTKLPDELQDLLAQTNGVGEKLTLADRQIASDLGRFLFSTPEIAQITIEFRKSDLPTDLPFNEMLFFGTPHVDGIYFAIKQGENIIYAWYPSEQVFRPIASTLKNFIYEWLSDKLSL